MNITLVAENNGLCTEKIQNAINDICASGGGILTLSGGEFLSGSIELKSNLCFCLEAGATLKASGDIENFAHIGFYHNEMKTTRSLLWARDAYNITICGDGVIDFGDENYYDFDNILPFDFDISTLTKEELGECVVAKKNSVQNTINQPIFFESCKNIKIRDINLFHSTFWTITFSRCKDALVTGVNIENRFATGNSDGIHISASKNIIISDCNIKAGDDCVAITCITDEQGISENITVSNCNFESSSAGIRIGHLYSKVKNVCISNINITNSNRGIAIFAKDDGYISNISISDININTRILYGAWWGKGEPIVICAANSNGVIENVHFKNIFAKSENGIVIAGQNNNIKDISISDMKLSLIESKKWQILGNRLDIMPNSFDTVLFDKPFYKYVDNADVSFNNFTTVKI